MFTKVLKVAAPTVLASLLVFGATPSFAYEVKKGDTLSGIAKKRGVALQEIIEINPQISDYDLIYIGDSVNTVTNKQTETGSFALETKEKDLLARLVEAEAKGEVYAGKVAVAKVVLNRVESEQFPDTVTEVIKQPRQFTPVSNGSITKPASKESIKAVEEAVITEETKGSLFFYNPKIATSRWLDSKETTTIIGNHVFKK
jgi:N-acetylmuramoyl-L-alanine amidase